MALTLQMLKENFDVINELFFDNKLKTPRFEITNKRSYLGQYHWRYDWRGELVDSVIRISNLFDRTDEEIVNTLAHEMIHLYIRQHKIIDTRPHHGRVFYEIADRLNRDGGFHIARTDSVAGCGLRVKSNKTFYVACFCDVKGKFFQFVFTPTAMDYYKDMFDRNPKFFQRAVMFKSTDDKKFAHYRTCRKSLRGFYITEEEYNSINHNDVFYKLQTLKVSAA